MSNRIREYLPTPGNWLGILLGILSLAGLYAISHYDFLLFHCLAEGVSIIIAIAVFAIFWNTRQFLDNGVYLVIGLGCLFAAFFDVIYVLSYPGMTVLPQADGNTALQAKTVAQWYVSLSCVGAAFFLRRRIRQGLALWFYGAVLVLAFASIFYWRIFPDCFVEGVGITPFERIGLVISCIAYFCTLVLLFSNRREFDSRVFKLLAATLIAFLVQDAACAVAKEINGPARTIAHLCQVTAIYFVYKAFVEVGLRKPYAVLFRSQQQSREALERQEQFLQAVLDNAQCGIIACDAEGVLTVFNRALREFHGLPQECIPPVRWAEHYDLYHPDGKTPMRMEELPLYRALRGEPVHDFEMVSAPKGKPARTFVASGAPLRGTNGESRGAVVAVHDVTDRRRAEDALRESEERYRQLFQTESDAIFVVDCQSGRVVDANAAALELYGYTREECFSLPVTDLSAEPERTLRAIDRGETHIPIRRHRKKDGTVFPVEIRASYFECRGRRVHVAAIRDITERIRAEQELRASEERYRLLVDTIPQIAWRAGDDCVEMEYNRRWYEYTGQTPSEVASHGWLMAVHPEDRGRLLQKASHAVSTKQPCQIEYRLRRASDATYRWHLARAVPALGEDGRVTCWFGSATDIEDLKQAQEILERAHDEALQRHQAELAHVARLSVMGEMTAGLAHELNQPLHAMKNYAQGCVRRLSKTPQRDEELVAALQQISREANRAADIVRLVKRFVEKRERRVSEVSLNNLLHEVFLLSKPELEPRHARVLLELAQDLPSIHCDPVQIEQVVMNLLRNGLEAMDQTPEEERVLAIKTMRLDDEMVQVEVRDFGKGIGAEELKRVFEPFFTTKPEGMGMGLAISRSIVHASGGRLWVSLNPDRGCTFHFTLPVGKRK
ncbi:MAG TPA: MASE3 domain-containing protein [Sedimentisphaerales bacterium]|mgnify:CR=1 FL=1|nr:MASE3 domain-containing protein [Sedimentisphaerales bacterium]